MSGSNPSRSPITPIRAHVVMQRRRIVADVRCRSKPNRSPISVAGRDQFSQRKGENRQTIMQSSLAAPKNRRNASTPRR